MCKTAWIYPSCFWLSKAWSLTHFFLSSSSRSYSAKTRLFPNYRETPQSGVAPTKHQFDCEKSKKLKKCVGNHTWCNSSSDQRVWTRPRPSERRSARGWSGSGTTYSGRIGGSVCGSDLSGGGPSVFAVTPAVLSPDYVFDVLRHQRYSNWNIRFSSQNSNSVCSEMLYEGGWRFPTTHRIPCGCVYQCGPWFSVHGLLMKLWVIRRVCVKKAMR